MSESIDRLKIRDKWRIYRCRKLIHAEELCLDINEYSNARVQCMLHHYSAVSTIVFVSDEHEEGMNAIKNRINSITKSKDDSVRFGASVLPSRLVVRVLADSSYQLRKFLIPCLEALTGRPVPTVWNV